MLFQPFSAQRPAPVRTASAVSGAMSNSRACQPASIGDPCRPPRTLEPDAAAAKRGPPSRTWLPPRARRRFQQANITTGPAWIGGRPPRADHQRSTALSRPAAPRSIRVLQRHLVDRPKFSVWAYPRWSPRRYRRAIRASSRISPAWFMPISSTATPPVGQNEDGQRDTEMVVQVPNGLATSIARPADGR